MIWGFTYAFLIKKISNKFSFIETFTISWIFGFVLMWLVAFNLAVLPLSLLIFAIPLSLIESIVATYICKRFA